MTIQIHERVNPLRKPKGFEPVVQRWSTAFVNGCEEICVAFHGVQGRSAEEVQASPFFRWIEAALVLRNGPTVHDHAWFVDQNGLHTHIVAAYWVDRQKRDDWMTDLHVKSWWENDARLTEPTGYFRESITVPVDRQESIYWLDYPAGLMRSKEVAIYPTPYCGYYGAMRDRIPLAAADKLESPMPDLPAPKARATKGARWRIVTPENLAIIRSAAFWGRCDPSQTDDYMRELRAPLLRGMDFLKESPTATGCASLRFQQTCDVAGQSVLETHALGYFLSLKHMENWAEHHASHEAIFSAAIARYRKYGKANQLRTWHEVFVIPKQGNVFEYVNCTPGTGLSSYFDGEKLSA